MHEPLRRAAEFVAFPNRVGDPTRGDAVADLADKPALPLQLVVVRRKDP
jgi:hypothetical protein